MKKLIFAFLFFNSFSSFSQSNIYHPFPDSNAVWNEEFDYFDYHPTPMSIDYYSLTISGDTTINGTLYHKLIIPYVNHYNVPPYFSSQNVTQGYNGAIRQDINVKKVFFVAAHDSVETLLYNFNLNIGDTIPDSLGCFITVNSIDSILIGSDYRKRWIISGTTQPVEIIEGIGGTRGLHNTWLCYLDGFSTNLNCFQQNGTTHFPNSSSVCNLINSGIEVSNRNSLIEVLPNPIHTSAIFKTKIIFDQLRIYNSLGICVRNLQIETADLYFDRGSLPNGIYYFHFLNRENVKASGIFIID